MIDKKNIEQLFKKMHHAGWNMHQQLAWGYFFKDASKETLTELATELQECGYEMIDINRSYPDNLYWLQIERVEEHSVDSLDKRNQEFYQLAKKMNIHSYDGMDVSPVDLF